MNVNELEEQAERGLSPAQTILGCAFLYGELGLEPDYEKAHKLLSIAAEKGVSRAALNLGFMYEEGLGVEVDINEAIGFFEQVAQSELLAAVELGRMYARGAYLEIDENKACYWYSVALAQADSADRAQEEIVEATDYIAKHCRLME